MTELDKALGQGNTRQRGVAKPLPPHVAAVLRELAHDSGITGDAERADLVTIMRWHLELGPKPLAIGGLPPARAYVQQTIRRRAWELVDANRHRLPAIPYDREEPIT